MSRDKTPSAQALSKRVSPGRPQPALTAEIERCDGSAEAKAGLFLMNGDWKRAHEVAQELDSPTAAYWHALVHRHEPDFDNSKYWLRRVGRHPVHAALAAAAKDDPEARSAMPKEQWDPIRFTDCYRDSGESSWTRRIEAIELRALLDYSLAPPERGTSE